VTCRELAAAALLAACGAAGAGELPSPPAPETHGRLVAGQAVRLEAQDGTPVLRVVPPAGALYLEQPAWTWLLDARRHAEARADAALEVAGRERWRSLGAGAAAGFAAGSTVWAARSDAGAGARWTAVGAAVVAAALSITVLAW
jgi:hypothetical protein